MNQNLMVKEWMINHKKFSKFEGNIDNDFLRLFFLIRQNTGGVFDTLYQYMKIDRRQNIENIRV